METEKEILLIESKESTMNNNMQYIGAPLESEEIRQAYGYGRIHTSEADPQFSDEDDDQPPF